MHCNKHFISIASASIALGACMICACLFCFLGYFAPVAEGHAEPQASASHADHEGHSDEHVVALTAEQIKDNGVELAEAGPGNLASLLALPGEIKLNADKVAHVVPRISGVAREVFKNAGDDVRANEVMAILDSRELATLKAAYYAAREREQLARALYDREKGLWEKKISAEQDYLNAKNALAEAGINTNSAEQQLHAIGFSDAQIRQSSGQSHEIYTRYEIVAPFDGTVVDKHITLGESLKDDAACFTIADLDIVWADLNVYQKDIAAIHKGDSVLVRTSAESQDAVSGTITFLGPIMGEETRTTIARVALPNKDRHWRPGQFITGFVETGQTMADILVPKTAIQTVEKVASIFIETPNGFEAVPVTMGRSTDTHVEIITGLAKGQQYVSAGAFVLKAALEKSELGHEH